MASLAKAFYTPEQYLALEREASYKSEYFSGEIFAMAGASFEHNQITANLMIELGISLRKSPCRPLSQDQRVMVRRTGLYTYPDVLIVCGQPQFTDDHLDTLTNPAAIFEVLSPSTEAYDRGEKFAHYRQIESLTYYGLLSQDQTRVELFQRQDDHWTLRVAEGVEGVIELPSLNVTLRLSELYDGVAVSPPPGR